MKKQYLIISGVILAVLIVGGIIFASNKKGTTTTKTVAKTSSTPSYKVHEACDILTKEVAVSLSAADAGTTDVPDTKSGDINVSNCTYYSVSSKTSIGLLARSPKSKAGADSNDYQFNKGLPADAQKVDGFGDAAYWSPSYGQLNILQGGTWYILSLGSVKASERNLTQTEQFANAIKDQL